MTKKTLVLTGANGQLGKTIQKLWDATPIHDCFHLLAYDKRQLDITDPQSIQRALNGLSVDVDLSIDWPLLNDQPLLSDKDRTASPLSTIALYQ